MKKDRNCGMTPYPVYQPYPSLTGGMMPQYTITNESSNTLDQQITQMQRQINNLEARVSKLESSLNTIGSTSFNSNQYTNGNYHVV